MKKTVLILIILIAAVSAGIWFLVSYDTGLVITRAAISEDVVDKQVISGTVENSTADKTYTNVGVDIKYLDASGKTVGQDILQTKSLGPHMVWGFKTKLPNKDIATFKIKASSVHIFGLRW